MEAYHSNFSDQGKEDLRLKGFKVFEIAEAFNPAVPHGRRDFFKIGMVTGDFVLTYGSKTYDQKGTLLFCSNPTVGHSVMHRSAPRGYACLFSEAFIAGSGRSQSVDHSPLFQHGASPITPVNASQQLYIRGLFQKMLKVYQQEYDYKNELLKSCLELVIHETLQMQPQQNDQPPMNAAMRITTLFWELLERQFPIENSTGPLRLRTAQDFAQSLSVHVNYLNRSVKEVTGKPTSTHIAERIAQEAKALLAHTDWSVADIAYGLGFEYPTYFNNYFKRITGTTPRSYRSAKFENHTFSV